MAPVACPRCGHMDTFTTGYLPDTCVCRVCQSQLDWREIPGMGPGCVPLTDPTGPAELPTSPASDAAGTEE